MHFTDVPDYWRIFCATEEALSMPTDRFGRVLYRDRTVSDVSHPVVSEHLYQNGFRPHYPGHQDFAVCISHDVDHLLQPGLRMHQRLKEAGKELLRGRMERTMRYFIPGNPINPCYNLEELLEIEDRLGIPSSFYFLALQATEEDYNYGLANISKLLGVIAARGCEIGLHGGHRAFMDREKLITEKSELQKNCPHPVRGFRNHFLRFRVPDTWKNLGAAGFSYDTTFGFPDHPGFRNGMCYPFFPYLQDDQRFSEVLEIPLIVMDATFIYYLKQDADQSFATIKHLVDKVRKINGVFTLLWHNNYLYKPWGQLFRAVVSYCKDSGAWFTTGQGLDQWWRKNNFCADYSRFGLQQAQR